MRLSYLALAVVTAACLFTAGCASHTAYYAPPPPPPAGYTNVPPLIARADQVGFRSGNEDGARDSYNGFGYHPQHDRKFTPRLATIRRSDPMSLIAMPSGEPTCAATTRDSIAASRADGWSAASYDRCRRSPCR